MIKLKSHASGAWHEGRGESAILLNPATEEPLAETSTDGIDFRDALDYARDVGGPALRNMTFAERGACLRSIYDVLYAHREELLNLSVSNGGNTRNDAKFDVDGANYTLLEYASYGKKLGDRTLLVDGDSERLTRNPRYAGKHILTPLRGAAVHINAYNFPAWGFMEKAAVALLAGMPVITKPATSTALLAYRMTELLVDAEVLPQGALSFIAGSTGDLLHHLGPQDVLAFTGSSDTAKRLRSLDAHVQSSMRINVEADSLNAAVLGPDVAPGSEAWQQMIRDITTDVRQKAGQKCTAIRRVLVPPERREACIESLEDQLDQFIVGNPADASVRVGPLVNAAQLEDVREGLKALETESTRVMGDAEPTDLPGTENGRGYFVTPFLFDCEDAGTAHIVHTREVFGPAVTVMAYRSVEEAAAICARGDGALVSSVYSNDRRFAREMLLALAPFHGRLTLGGDKVASFAPGPGAVLPAMVHGGPGRAGGGEELGGLRGLSFYLQRTAVQGYQPLLEKFFPGAD